MHAWQTMHTWSSRHLIARMSAGAIRGLVTLDTMATSTTLHRRLA